MSRWPFAAAMCLATSLSMAAPPAARAPLAASVENHTRPTLCAEEDNVSLTLSGAQVRRFRVEALPPVYLDRIERDITAPDFSNCNFDGGEHPTDPAHRFEPRTVTLHEDARLKLVGMTLPTFWRPDRVPVSVDGRRDRGFHMIQVYDKTGGGKPREALVMYPSDGYWRIKPLPTARFGDGVYGSSFVMGPIEDAGRPIARIRSIRITTQPLAFHLRFADGTHAQARVAEISESRTALDLRIQPGSKADSDARFAVLRSMYVTPDNADMSEVAWKAASGDKLERLPLPEVRQFTATDVRFGRSEPSRHNTSAPDIRFSRFAR